MIRTRAIPSNPASRLNPDIPLKVDMHPNPALHSLVTHLKTRMEHNQDLLLNLAMNSLLPTVSCLE